MNVTYQGEGKMFLHQEIGKGQMPDGRQCRLIQTNAGVHMQVYPKDEKEKWKIFSVSYMDLSKAIVDEIAKIEVAETQTTDSKKES